MMTDQLNTALRRVPVWAVYVAGLAPIPWLFWLALNGQLGVEPIQELEHRYGLLALQFLIGGLAITPMRKLLGVNLLKFRRAIGLIAFYFLSAHLLVWLLLDVQDPAAIWADILKRPYITIGMIGFLLLVPLAVTSNNWSVRKLGQAWRKLHKLVYLAVALGAVHFVMLSKGWQLEPMLYAAAVLVLLALRMIPQRRRQMRARSAA